MFEEWRIPTYAGFNSCFDKNFADLQFHNTWTSRLGAVISKLWRFWNTLVDLADSRRNHVVNRNGQSSLW
jgi:hypothetical protein